MMVVSDKFYELLERGGVFDKSNQELFEYYAGLASDIENYSSGSELGTSFLDNVGKMSTAIENPAEDPLNTAEAVVGMLGVLQGITELTYDIISDPKNKELTSTLSKKLPLVGAALDAASLGIDLASIYSAYKDPTSDVNKSDIIGVFGSAFSIIGVGLGILAMGAGASAGGWRGFGDD